MSLDDSCRELAAKMTDDDLVAGLTALGPDSPLLPAVRAEVRRRLTDRNDEVT
ncbi:hypothetical protein [Dietzia alimentaria]|uniref:hypothetical protein n=1 Tax=Dietzia alimentaria TaxID=665550 RepID=UPI001303188B|nr:hypothetical protein [Dietzia alimentaria]